MAALEALTEEEAALLAILTDPSGSELAEFMYIDEGSPDRRYRLWDFQWEYNHCDEAFQVDALARGLGKSVSSVLRACAFVFNYPGREMLITAPELNHLSLVTDKVEENLLKYRLLREMLPGAAKNARNNGIKKQPQFQASFVNGAKLLARLPQLSGKGVKGCLAAGSLVLTHRGHVPIEDVVVGDQVLTHELRWRPVTRLWQFQVDDAYEVSGIGHRGIVVSDRHSFYSRFNSAGPKQAKALQGRAWVDVTDPALGDHHWASPTSVPPLDAVWPEGWSGDREALLQVAGHYVAAGFLQKDASARGAVVPGHAGPLTRVEIVDSADMLTQIEDTARRAGFVASARPHHEHPQTTGIVQVCSRRLARWLHEQFGEHAQAKRLPAWLLGAPEAQRRAFWEAYAAGDGHREARRDRTTISTASKVLAADLRTLVATLGLGSGLSWVDPKVRQIGGRPLKRAPRRSYRVEARGRSLGVREHGFEWTKIKKARRVACDVVYDISVADDHSYVAEGVVHHNTHPIVIEQDELQDYGRKGFMELIETIKASDEGAMWRAHGVSNGVGDIHYELTHGKNPDLPFYVHKYIAAHRPTWNDNERKSKIAIYGGSEEAPDYVRNIFGEPGSIHNPVFVLARLMACVRINQDAWASEYNDEVYTHIKITDEYRKKMVGDEGSIADIIQIPMGHLDREVYTSYWAGMDVGYTTDPSEILVFGVVQRRGLPDLHRLLLRISLVRISAEHQVEAIEHVFEHYGTRLRRFGMDKTGNGLPLFQILKTIPTVGSRLAGYGFSEKKPVEFDDRELREGETPEDLVIVRSVIDFATDELRKSVDAGTLELPYDTELLGQWQGQGIQNVRGTGESAVRRYVGGADHTLDAARMYIAAKQLEAIEKLLEKPAKRAPVLDMFF